MNILKRNSPRYISQITTTTTRPGTFPIIHPGISSISQQAPLFQQNIFNLVSCHQRQYSTAVDGDAASTTAAAAESAEPYRSPVRFQQQYDPQQEQDPRLIFPEITNNKQFETCLKAIEPREPDDYDEDRPLRNSYAFMRALSISSPPFTAISVQNWNQLLWVILNSRLDERLHTEVDRVVETLIADNHYNETTINYYLRYLTKYKNFKAIMRLYGQKLQSNMHLVSHSSLFCILRAHRVGTQKNDHMKSSQKTVRFLTFLRDYYSCYFNGNDASKAPMEEKVKLEVVTTLRKFEAYDAEKEFLTNHPLKDHESFSLYQAMLVRSVSMDAKNFEAAKKEFEKRFVNGEADMPVPHDFTSPPSITLPMFTYLLDLYFKHNEILLPKMATDFYKNECMGQKSIFPKIFHGKLGRAELLFRSLVAFQDYDAASFFIPYLGIYRTNEQYKRKRHRRRQVYSNAPLPRPWVLSASTLKSWIEYLLATFPDTPGFFLLEEELASRRYNDFRKRRFKERMLKCRALIEKARSFEDEGNAEKVKECLDTCRHILWSGRDRNVNMESRAPRNTGETQQQQEPVKEN